LASTSTAKNIQQISVSEIAPGPWQPRRYFDAVLLQELAQSITTHGLLTPLRVVPDSHGYLILAGERRWRAAQLAGITELPCLVMDAGADPHELHELAILDNLHRSNLRPGEESRAVKELALLGLVQAQIARRLGKSQTWVSQRLAIARLPDSALHALDSGTITREEAIGLCKLISHPELLQACLDPDGEQLKLRLGGHVPDSIGERLQAAIRFLEIERQRAVWSERMRSEGHLVLDDSPGANDTRYVRLPSGTAAARAHQESRLKCDAWAWERGQPMRFCTDPRALQEAIARTSELDPAEQARRDDSRRVQERELARDRAISTWLATSDRLDSKSLGVLARQRITSLTLSDDRLLARLGGWLGCSGERASRAAFAAAELRDAREPRLIQLWFLLELALSVSNSIVPPWSLSWLQEIGFEDPAPK
jgi:ParB/RepB/Spo0J family partition protein